MKILMWPNLTLNYVSCKVTQPLDSELASEMERLMLDAGGVGLSAIQVGVPLTFFITKIDRKSPTKVYVNPIIQGFFGTPTPMLEGCLSLPGQFELIRRFPEIKISYWNSDLTKLTEETINGLEAHCCQHEVEHGRGELFVDKLPSAKRSTIRGNLQKMKRNGSIK